MRQKYTPNITEIEHLKNCSKKKLIMFHTKWNIINFLAIYLKGCLAGVPAFLGYFLGVSFTLSIIIIFLFMSVPGKQNSSFNFTFPPNTYRAKFASYNSSSIWFPFIQIIFPPTFTAGSKYSAKTLKFATARETAI